MGIPWIRSSIVWLNLILLHFDESDVHFRFSFARQIYEWTVMNPIDIWRTRRPLCCVRTVSPYLSLKLPVWLFFLCTKCLKVNFSCWSTSMHHWNRMGLPIWIHINIYTQEGIVIVLSHHSPCAVGLLRNNFCIVSGRNLALFIICFVILHI